MMAVIFRLSTDTGEESSSLSGIFTGFWECPNFYTETGTRYRIFYTYADLILGLRKGIGTGTKIHLFLCL